MFQSTQLLYPMTVYIFYIGGFVFYGAIRRIRSVTKGEVPAKYFRDYSDKSLISHRLLIIERHIDNQFQVPPLFFITCLVHLTLNIGTQLTLILAWSFVVSRFIHALEHLGKNRPLYRAVIYGTGWLILGAMWVQLIGLI